MVGRRAQRAWPAVAYQLQARNCGAVRKAANDTRLKSIYCWRSGQIEVGTLPARGSIALLKGDVRVLTRSIDLHARWDKACKAMVIPGVAAAASDDEALALMNAWGLRVALARPGFLTFLGVTRLPEPRSVEPPFGPTRCKCGDEAALVPVGDNVVVECRTCGVLTCELPSSTTIKQWEQLRDQGEIV